jgi:hypothetical protein
MTRWPARGHSEGQEGGGKWRSDLAGIVARPESDQLLVVGQGADTGRGGVEVIFKILSEADWWKRVSLQKHVAAGHQHRQTFATEQ